MMKISALPPETHVQPDPFSALLRRRIYAFSTLIPAVALLCSVAAAQGTTLVSLDSAGVPLGDCAYPAISADGRFVAFKETTTGNIYRRDTWTNTTVQVVYGGNNVTISGDGHFVMWDTPLDLDPADTNGLWDVYVCDVDNLPLTPHCVSFGLGTTPSNGDSTMGTISDDGRYVTFQSTANNLDLAAPQQPYHLPHDGVNLVYVRDVGSVPSSGRTWLITPFADQPATGAGHPLISGDGLHVAFNLDSVTVGGVILIDVPPPAPLAWTQVNLFQHYGAVSSISGNGGKVVYWSAMEGGLRLWNAGSVSYAAQSPQGSCRDGFISADGTKLLFLSDYHTHSGPIAYPDWGCQPAGPAQYDWYLRDLSTPLRTVPVPISQGLDGCMTNTELPGAINRDGTMVAYLGPAGTVPNFAAAGTFLRDISTNAGTQYCFGNGSGTACPCTYTTWPSLPHNGCPNSVNAQGAYLSAVGEASIGGDTLLLQAANMPDTLALFLQGTTQQNGGAGVVFGDGLRCVGGSLIRLGIKPIAFGSARFPDPTDPSVSARGQVTLPGTRTYQVWYRNPAAFCTSDTFNLSNGLQVNWL